jgi:hypothetical protein
MTAAATAARRKTVPAPTPVAPDVAPWWIEPAEQVRPVLDRLFETCRYLDLATQPQEKVLHLVSAARATFHYGINAALDANQDDPIDKIILTCTECTAVLLTALDLPHDSLGPQWPPFVHHAIQILDALSDLTMSGPGYQADLDEAIAVPPSNAIHALAHQPAAAQDMPSAEHPFDAERQAVITSSIIELMDWVDVVEQNYDQGPRFETLRPVLFERIATLGSAILSASDDELESTLSIRMRVDEARGSRGELV